MFPRSFVRYSFVRLVLWPRFHIPPFPLNTTQALDFANASLLNFDPLIDLDLQFAPSMLNSTYTRPESGHHLVFTNIDLHFFLYLLPDLPPPVLFY